MAKKKLQYPNRTRNNIITAVVAVALVALLATLVSLNIAARNYVVKFDGKKVGKGEYLVYLYQQKMMYESYFGTDSWSLTVDDEGTTLASYAMQSAYAALVQQKIAVKEAAARGLKLTPEQEQEAQTTVDEVNNSFTAAMLDEIGMSNKKLLQFMKDDIMQSVLYGDATKDYVMDEADFETYYENYLVENEQSLTKVNVNYILTDDKAKAEEAKSKIEAGEDVYALIKEYSIDYEEPVKEEGAEEEPTDERMSPQSVVNLSVIPDDFVDTIFDMEASAISDVYEIEEEPAEDAEEGTESTFTYLVVKVDNIELPDYDTVKEEQKETYQTEKKDAIYQELLDGWIDAATIEPNNDVLATIDITALP